MSVVQTTAGVWEPDVNNAVTMVTPSKHKLVTDTVTNWTAATAKNVATTGTAVGVFNSITSTQGTDGIKVITDVSGGGQAGEVITEGVAASVAPTVVTGWMTHNTGAGLGSPIKYVYSLNDSNKLVTSQFTPVAVGASVTVFSSFDSLNVGGPGILTGAATLATQQFLGYHSISAVYDDSTLPSNVFTLYLPSSCADGIGASTNNWGHPGAFHWGTTYVMTTSITPAIAGTTAITYATGSVGTAGSGATVVTGGSSQYLGYTSFSQTTNIPTVVSFGTVVINGTPSYIHTSNIVPAVANGTIVGLNTSATKTFATGSLAANGSGSTVVYDVGQQEAAFIDSQTSLTFPVFSLSTNGATGIPYINGTKDATVYTASESAHTHSYSKATAISVSAPTASAITSVSLTPAS